MAFEGARGLQTGGITKLIRELVCLQKDFPMPNNNILRRIPLLAVVLPVLLMVASTAGLGQTMPAAGKQLSPGSTVTAPYKHYFPIVTTPITALKNLVTQKSLVLPHPLAAMVSSWCTWSGCSISPRLYHEPRTGGGALVGWTDSSGDGHVSVIDSAGSLTQTFDYPGLSVRGLVAHDDGTFAVLQWNAGTTIMWLTKYDDAGGQAWSTNIKGSLTKFDPGIGDSRLAYGGGLYGAYFAVYGVSGWVMGHNGDQLTYVNSSGVIQSGGRDWGCSHSMAELINYHPALSKFMPVCSSDCYASKGILTNDSQVVYACDGNCGGLVSAQLGQVTQETSSWKVIFNALDRPGYPGKGIGLATINSTFQSSFIWLTNTNGVNEIDPVIARLGANLDSNRYLAGWKTSNDNAFHLAVISGEGTFTFAPETVSTAGITWGSRDDSFRTRPDGKVSWVHGNPGSATLNYFVFNGYSFLH